MSESEIKLECLKIAYKVMSSKGHKDKNYEGLTSLSQKFYNYCVSENQDVQMDNKGLTLRSKFQATTELL